MQGYEDIQSLIHALESTYRKMTEEPQTMEGMLQKAASAADMYANFRKNFASKQFKVSSVKRVEQTFSFDAFDWKALDHENPNPRS